MRIPRHLAIIMDGNGRWAEQRRLPRIVGHRRGVETVREIVEECRALGISFLTLYAFSSENWGRPKDEVGALMGLLGRYLKSELETMLTHKIRLRVIGEMGRLPEEVRKVLEAAIERTSGNGEMVLTLALSYGARDEMLRAVRYLVSEALAGRLRPEDLDENVFGGAIDTADLPDPDFLIRTSGEMRISNFLLWQLAYTELYFIDTLWPDFNRGELHRALREYGRRQRRFGLTGAQIGDEDLSPEEGHH
jgi:undecaprenyl diphosphate synthase